MFNLQPDVAAPGVEILAACRDDYVSSSGTSMATSHISGICALLKEAHPGWSQAAIKSALITTGDNIITYVIKIVPKGGSSLTIYI